MNYMLAFECPTCGIKLHDETYPADQGMRKCKCNRNVAPVMDEHGNQTIVTVPEERLFRAMGLNYKNR